MASQENDTRVEPGQRWQHVKRGTTYRIIDIAELQMVFDQLVDGSSLVIYQGDDGKVWAREESEFTDGRFTLLPERASSLSDALRGAHGIASGPDGNGRMKVVVSGLKPGTEHTLHQLLSSALVSA